VRRSRIHGRGLFALTDFTEGEQVIEYIGAVITWDEANRNWAPDEVGHTFLFDLGDGLVIDGGRRGNTARWMNHSCEPNCEATVVGRRVLMTATRDIAAGEELFLDYRLELDPTDRPLAHTDYACACGSASCRTTMARL
jgi:SET domain-containing protein